VKLGRPQAIVIAVPAGSAGKLTTQVLRTDPLIAPIAKWQSLATLRVMSGQQQVADVPLLALDAVEQAGVIGRAWDAMRLWIR
jgi:D-alanyl-D-alanine carboxypeptidase (penicillin-binding protein 5/6)